MLAILEIVFIKQKYHFVETVSNLNRKIEERGKIDTSKLNSITEVTITGIVISSGDIAVHK